LTEYIKRQKHKKLKEKKLSFGNMEKQFQKVKRGITNASLKKNIHRKNLLQILI